MNYLLALLIAATPCFATETATSGAGAQNTQPENSYGSRAERCGRETQTQFVPDRQGGAQRSGEAIATMVRCMAKGTKYEEECKIGCGNGVDYVECSNGFMANCGYKKVPSNNSALCKKSGAVRAYRTSPTSVGKDGHAEFVCGDAKYCSIYSQPFSAPWPKAEADSCWYPANEDGILPILGVGAAAAILLMKSRRNSRRSQEERSTQRSTGPQVLGTEQERPRQVQLGNIQVGNTNMPADLPTDGQEPVLPRPTVP